MSLRVAALIDSAILSGPGRQLAAVASQLRPRGVEVVVVLFRRVGRPPSPLVQHLAAAGILCIELPERGPLDPQLIARVWTVLRDLAPDVVQTHSYRPAAIVRLLKMFGLRLPWVAFQHGATARDRKVRFYYWLDRRFAARADRIVVMSEAHRDHWSRYAEKVRVIHNAVVPLPGSGVDAASPILIGARPAFGVVGRLSFEKGVDVFLRACAHLRDTGRVVSGVVVGDGPERHRLEALRDALGLRDVVEFRPSTPGVRSIYAAIDALVIPSRSEGLPNVLLEALAADLPVVATAVGGIPEVLNDSMAGLVVPAEDPTALAEAMGRIAQMGRTPAARQARRACVERFSLDARAHAHLTLYNELTAGRRISATP
jgi:glycosyltransferase involved in cell wall biosynthesis